MKHPLRPHALALALLSSFLIPNSSFAQSASPALIPFQGRLTDQTGAAYSTGQFTITFNLYDQAIGGTSVWTERHEKVSVINGMVNAFLGSVNSIDSVDFSTTKYLGIAVDADDNATTPEPEMVPRTMILGAFHAKKAEVATNATKLNGAGWDVLLTDADPTAGGAVLKADKIGDGVISAGKLADGSVTSAKIADGAITGQHIQDGSVVNDKLAAGTASANLAAEGLIALGARPIRVRGSIHLNSGAGIAGSTSQAVYTVPADTYAKVYISKFTYTDYTGGQNQIQNAKILVGGDPIGSAGGESNWQIKLWQEFNLGPGEKIEIQNSATNHFTIVINYTINIRGVEFTSAP